MIANIEQEKEQQTREAQIDKRLKQMPRSYRATYKKAVTGSSLRAAANSFCFECVGYVRNEVKVCTDLGCPLFPYRPASGISRGHRGAGLLGAESKKSRQLA
jgi:hypothetical protein